MPVSKQTKLLPYCRKPPGDKYELVFRDSRQVPDRAAAREVTVYRIRALRAVGLRVKKGDLGGYVQSLDNLAQDGDSWLAGDACAIGHSRVWGHAWVGENALLHDHAWAFENARIYGHSNLGGSARIFGNACVYGHTVISGNTLVSGHAVIRDNAHLVGSCWVGAAARVGGDIWCAGSQILTEGDWRGA